MNIGLFPQAVKTDPQANTIKHSNFHSNTLSGVTAFVPLVFSPDCPGRRMTHGGPEGG
jgi:hypothetical protein